MYSVKKFPDYEREEWIAEHKDLIEEQVEKFEGLDEALREPLEQVMAEYVFLLNVMEEVLEWKQNFARFLSYAIDAAEVQLNQKSGKEDLHRGRLSMIKEILGWF